MLTPIERATLRIINTFYSPRCAYEIAGVLDGYVDWAEPVDREIVRGAFRDARSKGLISRDELLEGYRVGIVVRSQHDDGDNPRLASSKQPSPLIVPTWQTLPAAPGRSAKSWALRPTPTWLPKKPGRRKWTTSPANVA